MSFRAALAAILFLFFAPPAFAQRSAEDLIGRWQGTIHLGRDLRVVLIFSKTTEGKITGRAYSIDQALGRGGDVRNISVIGNAVKMGFLGAPYQGALSGDGRSISGTYDLGFPSSMKLTRVVDRAGWPLPLSEDKQPHKIELVSVDKDVKVEVIDWGGEGPPLLFLSGLGVDAHAFDKFAPLFTKTHHVYGMTRRGIGGSGKPAPLPANYDNTRLGDDVLAMMDALKIDRAILAGWSFGGSEISSVATRRPERVSGAIFLDAGYAYTFYAPGNLIPLNGNLYAESTDLREKILAIAEPTRPPGEAADLIDKVLNTDLPQFEADLLATQARLRELPPRDQPKGPRSLNSQIQDKILEGSKKYPALSVPVLAFYAVEQKPAPGAPPATVTDNQRFAEMTEETVERFAAGNPKAKIVRIPNGVHDLFHSDEKIVAREMKSFMATLR